MRTVSEFKARVKFYEGQRGLSFTEALEASLNEFIDAERERCAKIAEEKVSFSPMQNPSERDRGWKIAARKIAEEIRRS